MLVLAALTALVLGSIWLAAPDRIGKDKLTVSEKYTPRLGLDLEGGTQVILTPRSEEGTPDEDQLNQAVAIIRNRVDSFGVAEAEVTRTSRNIIISIPGAQNQDILETVKQTAELRFRQVLVAAAGIPTPQATPPAASPSPSGAGSPSPSGAGSPSPAPSGTPSASPDAEPTTDSRAVPKALRAATSPSPVPSPPTNGEQAGGGPAIDQKDLAAAEKRFAELDCSNPEKVRQEIRRKRLDKPGKPLATCSEDGAEKYILGPAEVLGKNISDASARLRQSGQTGFTTGEWEVVLDFDGTGARQFGAVTRRLFSEQGVRNQFGIVLDGLVVSAPTTQAVISNGQASITGGFTQADSQSLANVLKYGSLPITFDTSSVDEISATLGGEQLTASIVAGLIGLALVVVYSLAYYRGLGLVTVASLAVAALMTYGLVTLLGWQIGFRLSLAGVAGLIVAIGITADSFVVYFERLRDEVRDGKTLRVAVETGWARARRTILAADFVSLLAAVVLYALSVGGVRGFAFALGLTTVVDILVVFLFTKPLVTLLARTKFFGGGHKLSGLDPEHLGTPRRTLTSPASGRRSPARPAAATRIQEG